MAPSPNPSSPVRQALDDMSIRLAVSDDQRLDVRPFSQGQKKRLASALALASDKPLCLFDEWTADQDPEFRAYFHTRYLPGLQGRRQGPAGHQSRRTLFSSRRPDRAHGRWAHRLGLTAGRRPARPERCRSPAVRLNMDKQVREPLAIVPLAYPSVRLRWSVNMLVALLRRWGIYIVVGLVVLGSGAMVGLGAIAALLELSVAPLFHAAGQPLAVAVLITLAHSLAGALIVLAARPLLWPRSWAEAEAALPISRDSVRRNDLMLVTHAVAGGQRERFHPRPSCAAGARQRGAAGQGSVRVVGRETCMGG